tara:strand:- start:402 stop:596 length:195 start_codon:yes stop_codon:yes gene_type:complete
MFYSASSDPVFLSFQPSARRLGAGDVDRLGRNNPGDRTHSRFPALWLHHILATALTALNTPLYG